MKQCKYYKEYINTKQKTIRDNINPSKPIIRSICNHPDLPNKPLIGCKRGFGHCKFKKEMNN